MLNEMPTDKLLEAIWASASFFGLKKNEALNILWEELKRRLASAQPDPHQDLEHQELCRQHHAALMGYQIAAMRMEAEERHTKHAAAEILRLQGRITRLAAHEKSHGRNLRKRGKRLQTKEKAE